MQITNDDRSVSRPGRLRRLIRAGIWIYFGIMGVVLALTLYYGNSFDRRMLDMDRRMKAFGGGFSNGRRDFRRHVGAWAHDPSLTDSDVPRIAAALKGWDKEWSDKMGVDLSGTGIVGPGLASLRDVTAMEYLNLRDTKVDDPGLAGLVGISTLKSVNLRGTKVTSSGVAALRRDRPDLVITWDGGL